MKHTIVDKTTANRSIATSGARTLKHQLYATISSSSGSTNKAQQKFLTSETKQS
jgi:hypothetical protein